LVVPPLGFAAGMVSVAVWLVSEGAAVLEGDRVVQLVAGAATVDLLAPVTGRLQRQLVDEDQPVEPGERLAIFTAAAVEPRT
jgi:pyruvate/2-oxoglutarate dehydrogenase complex dihydrolipoamide acyltransferase (E2) component